jgi:hypothetical protein
MYLGSAPISPNIPQGFHCPPFVLCWDVPFVSMVSQFGVCLAQGLSSSCSFYVCYVGTLTGF